MTESQEKRKFGINILAISENFPLYLRKGPWSPFASAFLVILCVALFLTKDLAMKSFNDNPYEENEEQMIRWFRLGSSIYSFLLISIVLFYAGIFPLYTYTILTWNIMTLRLFSSYLNASGYNQLYFLARALRFPALVGCTVTVSVWWFVLVPVIYTYANEEQRLRFLKFNFSFFLLNVHGLNLVFTSIDFLYSSYELTFFDFWMAAIIGFSYILFYLFYVDAKGYHLYIIFSPRTHLCILAYFGVLLIYYFVFWGWNEILRRADIGEIRT